MHFKKIIKLFPARESLVSGIPAGDGRTAILFLQCGQSGCIIDDGRRWQEPILAMVNEHAFFSGGHKEMSSILADQ